MHGKEDVKRLTDNLVGGVAEDFRSPAIKQHNRLSNIHRDDPVFRDVEDFGQLVRGDVCQSDAPQSQPRTPATGTAHYMRHHSKLWLMFSYRLGNAQQPVCGHAQWYKSKCLDSARCCVNFDDWGRERCSNTDRAVLNSQRERGQNHSNAVIGSPSFANRINPARAVLWPLDESNTTAQIDGRSKAKGQIMANSPEQKANAHLLVVIDHHEARVYRTEVHGAVPMRVEPYDPHGYGRHLHSASEWTDGKGQHERKSFYEAIAKTLQGAEQVLMFGSGTGKSSAMEHLLGDLRQHHADVAKKVIGSIVVDTHHATENQLLARAREFYEEYNRK